MTFGIFFVARKPIINGGVRPNKLTFLVLVSIPLKKWRCGANFLFFFFLSAVKSRGIPMLTNMYLMVYEQYKFHLSIVCDM